MTEDLRRLQRLAVLAGLVRELRLTEAARAEARVAALREGLAAPELLAPPGGTDAPEAAQHARWAAWRRAGLQAALAQALPDLAARQAQARRALGTDQAVDGLIARARDDLARKARRL